MDVGLALPQPDLAVAGGPQRWQRIVELSRAAEDLGFRSLWLADEATGALEDGPPGALDPVDALGALARLTARCRLGTLALRPGARPPVVLAKALATVDVLSEGRLVVGFDGARAGTGEGTDELAELLEVVGGVFGGGPFTYLGDHYRTEGIRSLPTPVQQPRPPLWVVGPPAPDLLGVVAGLADGWVASGMASPDDLARAGEALEQACRTAGRRAGAVARVVALPVVVVEHQSQLADRLASLGTAPAGLAVGTPEEVGDAVAGWAAAASGVILVPDVLTTVDDVAMLARACSLGVDVDYRSS